MFDPPRYIGFLIKSAGEFKSGYIRFNIAPSVFYEINNNIDVGMTYTIYTNYKDLITENVTGIEERLSLKTLGIHLRLKIRNPK